MNIPDKKMLKLIEILVAKNYYHNEKQFCTENKILNTTVSKVKSGICHFTVPQIEEVCKKHQVNLNWVFGIDDNVFLPLKKVSKPHSIIRTAFSDVN
jgi:hypothetical protein